MTKIIRYKFKPANTIGKEETLETLKVMKSGELSSYLGSKGPEFLGGKYVNNISMDYVLYGYLSSSLEWDTCIL